VTLTDSQALDRSRSAAVADLFDAFLTRFFVSSSLAIENGFEENFEISAKTPAIC
jgi:hypothetical protein